MKVTVKTTVRITEKEDQNNLIINGKHYIAINTKYYNCVGCAFDSLDDLRHLLDENKINICGLCNKDNRKDKRNIVWRLKKEEATK